MQPYFIDSVFLSSFVLVLLHGRISYSLYSIPVAQWLRHCATNWKVAGSIPDGVIGIFY
jgi:hypothetical protein